MFKIVESFSRLTASTTGIMFMVAHALCMAVVVVITKHMTLTLHPSQVAFLYKATILLAITPWCFLGGIRKNLYTNRIGMHVARSAFSIMGTLFFVSALANMNTLDATALTYLEPIVMMILGGLYLKEKLSFIKIVMILLNFTGAMLIINPSFLSIGRMPSFDISYVYMLLALIFWAGNNLIIKLLGRTEHTKTQLFYLMLISSLFAFPLALRNWEPLHSWHIKYLAGLATSHLLHSVCFFKALKKADISLVMPFDYTRLLFTGVMAHTFLGEVPSPNSIFGYSFIIIGGVILVHHEARKYKNKDIQKKEKKLKELESEYEAL